MPNYGDQNVRCPYYRRRESAGRVTIVCEGLVGDTVAHRFGSHIEANGHFIRHCCGAYKSCRHGAALEQKWAEE